MNKMLFAPLALFLAFQVQGSESTLHPQKIEELTGLKGSLNEKENVFKVGYARDDLKVKASGVHITPPLGLTAWAAFTPSSEHVSVMGDIVMTEDQVNPVMSAALDSGLDVTALHNHFFYDTPKIMFMHIGGMGEEEKLARAVGAVFKTLKDTSGGKGKFPRAGIEPAKGKLTTDKLDSVFGKKGDLAKGVYKFTFGKKTKMNGHEMGSAMGVNTWAAFAGQDSKALVDGDFAMYENEVQSTLKALRKAGINIVAIHNHMTGEEPRIIFLHFWGVGPATELAEGVKSALAVQSK